MENPNPNEAETSQADSIALDLAIAGGIGILVATLGGYLCGLAIEQFGELGSLSVAVLGWFGGTTVRKLMSRPRPLAGWILVIAVFVAIIVAETMWIRWNIKDVNDWGKAVSLLPQFCKQYSTSALFAGIFAVFGAISAYREAGIRYRVVQIVERD